jgi:hypothetical protein
MKNFVEGYDALTALAILVPNTGHKSEVLRESYLAAWRALAPEGTFSHGIFENFDGFTRISRIVSCKSL